MSSLGTGELHTGVRRRSPIDRLLSPWQRFLRVEAASGILLLAATLASLLIANSPLCGAFARFWSLPVGVQFGSVVFHLSLRHLVNDGLMTIFFFVVGLEVKREMVSGELRTLRRAAFPVLAAIGGVLFPAGIYLFVLWGKPGAAGWGIPMATDIAFVVGCMALLGSRIPNGLRIALLSLAIVDDIVAILVIAFGYSQHLSWGWLLIGFTALGAILLFQKLGVRRFFAYGMTGVFCWYAFHESGVHATIAGVLLGLITPVRRRVDGQWFWSAVARWRERFESAGPESVLRLREVRAFRRAAQGAVSPLDYFIDVLHPWVSFGIMPLFAFANAGVEVHLGSFSSPLFLAVVLGLVLGKPAGIYLAGMGAVHAHLAELPDGVTRFHVWGGGVLSGIGFTMALFIASLALDGPLLEVAKAGILSASTLSAVAGCFVLSRGRPAVAENGTKARP